MVDCFTSTLGAADDNETATSLFVCLWAAVGDCDCTNTEDGGSPDASSNPNACVDYGITGSKDGEGTCSSTFLETCGDATYQAVCSCPDSECVCFGDVTTVVAYSGCPQCPKGPDPDVLAACGFPK